MITFEQEWQEFKTRLYRDGMTPEQEKQIRRAFAAGAFITIQFFDETANSLPETHAIIALEQFSKDCVRAITEQIKTCEERN